MHRLVRDQLEEVLAGSSTQNVEAHLEQCRECREEVAEMLWQSDALHELRVSMAPGPEFYARVMQRVEADAAGSNSMWALFGESVFGRRIATASVALALLLGIYMVSSEPASNSIQPIEARYSAPLIPGQQIAVEDGPGLVLSRASSPDPDSVLVNLVTYREQ